jgi:hypothetical protein
MLGILRRAQTPQVTGASLAARRAEGYVLAVPEGAGAAAGGYLRRLGEAPQPPSAPATSAGVLLERYRRYLVTERGLAATTARGYADMVRPFLAGREDADGLGLGELAAAEVTAFVLATCPGMPKGSAKLTVTAPRSLGWLALLFMRWRCSDKPVRRHFSESCLAPLRHQGRRTVSATPIRVASSSKRWCGAVEEGWRVRGCRHPGMARPRRG